MTDNVDLFGKFIATPTNILLFFNGQYGVRRVVNAVEYQRLGELEHSLDARLTRDDSVLFQSSFNVNLTNRKSLAIDIKAGRRITLDAVLLPDVGGSPALTSAVEIFWDRDGDPTRSFEFSGNFSGYSGSASLRCVDRLPLRAQVEWLGNKELRASAKWGESRAMTMDVKFQPTGVSGHLVTPFHGFERVSFDAKRKVESTRTENEVFFVILSHVKI